MKVNYFEITDILVFVLWIVILTIVANSISAKYNENEIKKYFLPAYGFKVFMALVFAIIYIVYFGGGDTTAYWEGANTLNKLLFQNPNFFWEQLVSDPTEELRVKHFSKDTGFPPGWIYREKEAWFVCKITTFISLLTFRSYLAATVIFAFTIFLISFKLFEVILKFKTHSIGKVAFAFLFMPSLAFWCSGVSKDTLTYWSILVMIFIFLKYFVLKEKLLFIHVLMLFLSFFIIYNTRVFILAATIAPLLMAYGTRLTKKYEKSPLAKFSIRMIIIGGGFSFFLIFLGSGFASELVNEAQIIQQDFQNNPTYTGKRYEVNTTDASPTGLLKVMPISVFYGIFKPLPYESISPTLLLNGIESAILIYFAFIFITRLVKNIRLISRNEFLVFSLFFVVFIGFMAGFSSVLYGVLVRIRAPLLPFVFLLLTIKELNINSVMENKEKE